MKKELSYFPFFPDDFLLDENVEAMSTEQVGCYTLLICRAWRQNPPCTIPNDDSKLAAWVRLSKERWTELRSGVLCCFTPTQDGRLLQKRLRSEYDKIRARYDAFSKGGKNKGYGDDRKHLGSSLELASKQLPTSSGRIDKDRDKKREDKNPPTPQGGAVSDNFDPLPEPNPYPPPPKAWKYHHEDIYRAYPRRDGRFKALGAIQAALRIIASRIDSNLDPSEWLLERVKAFSVSPAGNAGHFTPTPARWFEDGRYDDDPATWNRDGPKEPDPTDLVNAQMDRLRKMGAVK